MEDTIVMKVKPAWSSLCEELKDKHIITLRVLANRIGLDGDLMSKDEICSALAKDLVEYYKPNDRPSCDGRTPIEDRSIDTYPEGELLQFGDKCMSLDEYDEYKPNPLTGKPYTSDETMQYEEKIALRRPYHKKKLDVSEFVERVMRLIECDVDGKLIGEGSYGSVYLMTRNDDKYVAKLQKISDYHPAAKIYARTYGEYESQRLFSMIGLAPKVYGVKTCDTHTVFVMDLVPDGYKLLSDIITSKESVIEAFTALVRDLKIAHSYGLQHGDLNPQNIFYNASTDKILFIDIAIQLKNRKTTDDWVCWMQYDDYYKRKMSRDIYDDVDEIMSSNLTDGDALKLADDGREEFILESFAHMRDDYYYERAHYVSLIERLTGLVLSMPKPPGFTIKNYKDKDDYDNLRAALVKWLADVSVRIGAPTLAYFRSIDLFDRYTVRKPSSEGTLLIIGCACIAIGCQITDHEVSLRQLTHLASANADFNAKDLKKQINDVLKTLKFDILRDTPYNLDKFDSFPVRDEAMQNLVVLAIDIYYTEFDPLENLTMAYYYALKQTEFDEEEFIRESGKTKGWLEEAYRRMVDTIDVDGIKKRAIRDGVMNVLQN